MTKIFLGGTESFMSKGVNALALRTMQIFSESIKNPQFILLSIYPEIDYNIYNNNSFNISIIKRNKSKFLGFLQLLNEYRKADIVIDTNGGGFDDEAGSTFTACGKLFLAYILGKEVILMPQSYGPFRSQLTKFLVKKALKKTSLIFVRGKYSKKCLEEIGVDENTIYLVPDIVFGLQPASSLRIEEILKFYGVNKNHFPLIGINPSQLINMKTKNEKLKTNYVKFLSDFINFLIIKYNAEILLIPHEIYPKNKQIVLSDVKKNKGDDTTAIEELMLDLSNNQNIISFSDDYKVEELKGLIGCCDFFIGSRLHACVAAISQEIPTISIAYSYKYSEVLEGLENYIVDYHEIGLDDMKSIFDNILINRYEIINKLEKMANGRAEGEVKMKNDIKINLSKKVSFSD